MPTTRRVTRASRTRPSRFGSVSLTSTAASVSNTDAQFAGKVVLVNISGSWCPNCHDEAPFLAALYREVPEPGPRGRDALVRGARAAREPDAATRVRRRYGIEYTVLLAASPNS